MNTFDVMTQRGTAGACAGSGNAAALGMAEWLSLAAAPTFAIMALLTSVLGGGPLDALCSATSPLGGMVPMYVLMSAFHLAPWLRLVSRRAHAWRPWSALLKSRHACHSRLSITRTKSTS
jgi:hypothetical protein